MKGKTMEDVIDNGLVLSEGWLENITGGGSPPPSSSSAVAVNDSIAKNAAAVAAAAKFYAVRGERLETQGNARGANQFYDAANKILDKNEKAADYIFKR
jgi:hypothetical protein